VQDPLTQLIGQHILCLRHLHRVELYGVPGRTGVRDHWISHVVSHSRLFGPT
jgi:hypothetical protein